MSLVNLCRICFFQSNDLDLKNIFHRNENDETIATIISKFSNTTVLEGDGLPSTICITCFEKLTAAVNFQQQIITSDTFFRNELNKVSITSEGVAKNIVSECTEDNKDENLIKSKCVNAEHQSFVVMNGNHDVKPYVSNDKIYDTSSLSSVESASSEISNTHTTNEIDVYVCTTCDRYCCSEKALKKHRKNHLKKYCTVCDRRYVKLTRYKRHLNTHSVQFNQPQRCTYCFEMLNNSGEVYEHIKKHTSKKPYKCNMCFKVFKLAYSLYNHLQSHQN